MENTTDKPTMEENKAIPAGKTKGRPAKAGGMIKAKEGKDLQVKIKEGTNLFYIEFKQGGAVPEKLSGLYTSADYAIRAIEQHYGTTTV